MDKIKAMIEGVTQDIIVYTVEEQNISVKDAIDKIYNSSFFEKLSNSETGLYRESSAYNYSILRDEFADGKIIQKEI
jgi:hypothetical protein